MTPDESSVLARLDQKVDDIKEDLTSIKLIVPIVYTNQEAIQNLKKSQAWIKRIMLSVLTLTGIGGVIAKLWPSGS